MSPGTALVASFLVTLVRPATWLLALAAFLVRGGLLLVLAPIVVIPSAVGLANVVAPMVTSLVFGGVSPGFVVLLAGVVLLIVAWLIGGGLVAAAAEAEMTHIVAADEDVAAVTARSGTFRHARRIVAVRLIAHGPLLLALVWGSARLVTVAYRELTVPSDVVTPVVMRVLRAAPDTIAIVLVAWLLAQVVGSLAARRVVLCEDGVRAAIAGALRRMLRAPVRTVVLELVPLGALVLVVVPSAMATAAAWSAVRASLSTGAVPLVTIVLVGLLVGLWAGGLALLAVVSAWRSAVWTVEVAGTFGVPPTGRAGDWNLDPGSGTLTDLRPRGVDPESR